MNTMLMRGKSFGLFIIATLALLLVIIPVNHIQAGAVMDGSNTGLNVAGQFNDPSSTFDAGWIYTAGATYTLGRIEAKFALAGAVPMTIEFYTNNPSLGGTLLASGTFTPTAPAPAGTNWEGVDLNNTVNVVSGTNYFVGFKNVRSVPSTDVGTTNFQLYYSTADNYATAGTGPQNAVNQPIVRFFSADPPTITSAAPPATGTQGVAYNHTYIATGSATITYTVTTGALPTGLTLSTAGVISGTPTASGLFTGVVTASNGATPDDTQAFSINIAAAPVAPTITSAAPPNGTIGVAYSHTFTASGNPAATFSVTGTLPTGITFNGVNTISGTPTAIGTFNSLSVTATNGVAPDATQNFSITINGIAPTITSAAPPNGTLGAAYSHTFTATGNPAATFSVTGTLPTGLTFNGVNTISGTPTAIGTFNGLSVTATNGVAPDATQNFSITINGIAPAFTSAAPPAGTLGVAYSHTFTASGNPAATFSVTGTLPTGLTFDGVNTISGTPTAIGTFNGLSVVATNGIAPDATQNFSITINGAAPVITSALPANGTLGVAYSHTFTATGNPAPTFSVTGTLPTGLSFDGVNTISGTPTAIGTFNGLSVVATNGVVPDATQNFSITINGGAPVITSAAPSAGGEGVAYSHTFTASGNPAPTFSLTGTLPTGLTFDGVSVISGTPTAAGTFNGISVTATNGVSPDATQNFSITINSAGTITVSPATLPNSTVGAAYNQNITAAGGTGPYTFSVTSGVVPTGLVLMSTGNLSGTTTVAGTFNFTVTATDMVAATGSQAYTIVVSNGTTPTVTPPVVTHLPEPPPAPYCTDTNFEVVGMIRTHFTNDADRAGLSCRLLAANGSYLTWLGGPLTNAGMVGDKTVLDLGVVAAVDVFSGTGKTGFVGDVNICLKGSGYMIYFNASGSPRVPQLWSAWKTDAFPGYTCTTLYAPGTVVLVANKP